MKILVMRPSNLGKELVDNLNQINIQSWHFSLFDFLPSVSEKNLSKKKFKLYTSNAILVFSKMSIYYTNVYLKKNNLIWPPHVAYYAIGNSTANLLKKYVKKKFFFLKKKKIVKNY